MKVNIYDFVEGAKKATGSVVIIDVFRAFTTECYAFYMGAKEVRPIGSVEDALSLKTKHNDYILVAERGGVKLEGADYGNSPTDMLNASLQDKTLIHSTHAGTQGIVNAKNADEILTGALVNAKAIAKYLQNKDEVSIVCMGYEATSKTDEDTICAEYIKALLLGEEYDADMIRQRLFNSPASIRFLDPDISHSPRSDWEFCTDINRFDFVIKASYNSDGKLVLKPIK